MSFAEIPVTDIQKVPVPEPILFCEVSVHTTRLILIFGKNLSWDLYVNTLVMRLSSFCN